MRLSTRLGTNLRGGVSTDRRREDETEVCLLDAFPRLAGELAPDELDQARGELTVRIERVPRGRWAPPPQWHRRDDLGLFVVDGLLARDVVVGDTTATELIGRGDLLRPADHEGEQAPIPFGVSWTVLEPLSIAILDADVTRAICRWPPLVVAIMGASVRRAFGLAHLLALSHLRRVDARLLVMLWHLADRWGTVQAEGVVVPLRLTHEMLGHAVGAQRPSVTTALNQLEAAGRISRRPGGGWVLHGAPPTDLA
ncbi:MAG: Crp/Fnr family transcriptional regulator [Actinobacteria bacterium]|nr:Crp/Fnr family transcriptional regulator [Actinomycetota bacterium]